MIRIERPGETRLAELGVTAWPTWAHGIDEFPWSYAEAETCFILAGEAIVTPDDGEAVRIGAGDLITFPAGMQCRWNITEPVTKHYRFD